MKVNKEESEGAEFILFQTEIDEMKETEVKKSELFKIKMIIILQIIFDDLFLLFDF